jgi:hypothetical protein
VKIRLSWKNFFLENSKWLDDGIFQKFQDFITAQQLDEMISLFDML